MEQDERGKRGGKRESVKCGKAGIYSALRYFVVCFGLGLSNFRR